MAKKCVRRWGSTPDPAGGAYSAPPDPLARLWDPTGWRRGVVVSRVRRMDEVNARRARLVPGWVTVFGRVYQLGM